MHDLLLRCLNLLPTLSRRGVVPLLIVQNDLFEKTRKIHDSKSNRFECRINREILEGA
jgi:hypothetical protein